MANQLTITKESGGYFRFDLIIDEVAQPAIRSIKNNLLSDGDELHFKTSTGANIVKKQGITPTDLTIEASGIFTFTTITEVWNKLIEIDYFGTSGTGTGVDRFDDLLDTFNYFSNDGKVCIVNESQQKIEASVFYNKRFFTDLDDCPSELVANKMVVVNPEATALILVDQPTTPPTVPTGTIFFLNVIPEETQTVFDIPENSMVVSMHIDNAFIAPMIRWIQEDLELTLLEITAEANSEVCFCLITT